MQWIKTTDTMPNSGKCLAICVSKKDVIYAAVARVWFHDTIYACRMDKGRFVIESHGPELPATHWMPMPSPPEWVEMPQSCMTCELKEGKGLDFPPENAGEPIPCNVKVKFCQDQLIAKVLLDRWEIPYKEEDLEDGPWGKCLRIKKKVE